MCLCVLTVYSEVDMSSRMSGSNLRDALFANENVWVDEIDEVLTNLDSDILGDSWVVNDGIYKEGDMWVPPTEENYSQSSRRMGSSDSVQFSYKSSCSTTTWFDYTSHFWVKYGHFTWDGRRSTETNQYGPREDGPSGFEETIDLREDVYTIDGYLVDTLTTPSVEKAVEHIEDQLEKVEERIQFNLDIEAAYGSLSTDVAELDDISDVRHKCPVRVSGSGSKSVERQSKYFGFYSNILRYPVSDSGAGTTSAYSHNPSEERIYENVNRAVSRYFELQDAGLTRSGLDPKDVSNYPKQRRESLQSYYRNHIHNGSNKSLIVPIGCRLGEEDIRKFKIGIYGSTVVYGRSDGCWEIVNCTDEEESLVVAIGTEGYEAEMLGMNKKERERCHQRSSFTGDAVDVLLDIANVRDGCSNKVDVVETTQDLVSSVQSFISDPTDWRPSLLNSYSPDMNARIAYLMSCIPKTILGGDWEYEFKTYGEERLILKYVPDGLTIWNRTVNKISISFNDNIYLVSDLFESDETFHSVSKIINELENRMDIIENMVRKNQFVENIHTVYQKKGQDVDSNEIIESESTEILNDICGVSTSTIKSIAEEYGTYVCLAETENDLSEYENHHFEKDAQFISEYTRQFTDIYKKTRIHSESDISRNN